MSFFYLKKVMLDGEPVSLTALEQDYLRPFLDERIYFALTKNTKSSPKLLNEPYSFENLNHQLENACRRFFSDENNVVIENSEKRILFSEIIKTHLPEIVFRKKTLVDYANQYREVPLPKGAEIMFLPFDWTL